MNIVLIGSDDTLAVIQHIIKHNEAGDTVFVANGKYRNGEQLVRRIIDADEIHIWDLSLEFELGMVYFYSVHALHFGLSWRVRLFGSAACGGRDSRTPMFADTVLADYSPLAGPVPRSLLTSAVVTSWRMTRRLEG